MTDVPRIEAPSGIDRTDQKRRAAEHAAGLVENRMVVGLGSGSTAELALAALARRVDGGLRITGIPTSKRAALLARQLGIPLTSFARRWSIDLTIDGADQVARRDLALIKGGGGALLREKIVAAASRRMVVVVDESKLVDHLGGEVLLPVETARFGHEIVGERLGALGCAAALRRRAGRPFVTDNGNYILDCRVAPIADPPALERNIAAIVGAVESGLFCRLASAVIVGRTATVETIER